MHSSLLDTIAALATPLGRSAIALVRVSGDRARDVLSRLAPQAGAFPPRRPRLVLLTDPEGEPIDHGIATLFAAPSSFTGEDVAEISVHGSPVVVERLLRAVVAAGARPARPGEFTERAFRLGKMDLVRAEAIRDLIDSRTEAAARASIVASGILFLPGGGIGSLFWALAGLCFGKAALDTKQFPRWIGYSSIGGAICVLLGYGQYVFPPMLALGLIGWIILIAWTAGISFRLIRWAAVTSKVRREESSESSPSV